MPYIRTLQHNAFSQRPAGVAAFRALPHSHNEVHILRRNVGVPPACSVLFEPVTLFTTSSAPALQEAPGSSL